MIPQNSGHVAVTTAKESTSFGISVNDSAHLMSILRDQLYSDKILAVLREYSTNAWDAHRMAGKSLEPIHVTLPTAEARTLVIRDFGPGISPEDMLRIFTQYGASSKRATNDAVGMLGIGSKSGFAYSESFEVVSFHGGQKRHYVAAMDESNKGILTLLHEEPSNETGFEVRISVKAQDVWGFQDRARRLFAFFTPRPVINISLPEKVEGVGETKSGVVFEANGNTQWTAVMGCVPYRLDFNQIDGAPAFVRNGTSGVLYFDIGDVQVSASREELKYSEQTKKAVTEKLDKLLDEFGAWLVNDVLGNSSVSLWERRWAVLKASALVPSVRSLPAVAALASKRVYVPTNAKFNVWDLETYRGNLNIVQRTAQQVNGVSRATFEVNTTTLFVVAETTVQYKRDLRNQRHVLLVPAVVPKNADGTTDHDTLLQDAQELLAQVDLAGAPLTTVQELRRQIPAKVSVRQPRSKPEKSFVLSGVYSRSHANCWKAEALPTDKPFILVPIERFHCEELVDLSVWQTMATFLQTTIPAVYAVRKAAYTDRLRKKYPNALVLSDWKHMVQSLATSSTEVEDLVKQFVRRDNTRLDDDNYREFMAMLPNNHRLRSLRVSLTPKETDYARLFSSVCFKPEDLVAYRQEAQSVLDGYPLLSTVLQSIRYYMPTDEKKKLFAGIVEYVSLIDNKGGAQ